MTTPERILIWDLTAGRTPVEAEPLEIPAQQRVAFSQDWARFVVDNVGFDTGPYAEFGPVLFDDEGNLVRGVAGLMSSEAIDPSGSFLATIGPLDTSRRGGVRVWGVSSDARDRLITSESTGSVAFHPDGKLLVTATPSGVEIWDITGIRVRVLSTTPATNTQFSRDGQFVTAIVSDDVRVWSFPAETALRQDLEHRLGYRDVSYDEVRSARGDNVDPSTAVNIRDFTPDECDRYQVFWCRGTFFAG